MDWKGATFERDCDCGYGCRECKVYAKQVNWNRKMARWLRDEPTLYLELVTAPLPRPAHLHEGPTPADCPLCCPPLPRPEWTKPGLYAQFKRAAL